MKMYKATVRPTMSIFTRIFTRNKSGKIKSQTNFGSKWDENTKENSYQNKNR